MTLRLILALLAAAALTSVAVCTGSHAAPVEAAAGDFKIDSGHTAVLFRINHLGVSHTWGRFNDVEGSFNWDPANPTKSAVKVTIKAESIDTASEARDGHLKGPDFFNVGQHPTITFASKGVTKTTDPTQFDVAGTLTLGGVAKAVTVRMRLVGEKALGDRFGYRAGFDGTLTIKRSEFGMTKMLDMIGDEVRLTLAFEGVRQ